MKKKIRFCRKVLFNCRKDRRFINELNFLKKSTGCKNYIFRAACFQFFFDQQKEQVILFLKWFLKRVYKKTNIKCFFKFFVHSYKYNTKKSLGIRMGKGKGAISEKFTCVYPGLTFLIIKNLPSFFFFKILRSLKVKFAFSFKVFKY